MRTTKTLHAHRPPAAQLFHRGRHHVFHSLLCLLSIGFHPFEDALCGQLQLSAQKRLVWIWKLFCVEDLGRGRQLRLFARAFRSSNLQQQRTTNYHSSHHVVRRLSLLSATCHGCGVGARLATGRSGLPEPTCGARELVLSLSLRRDARADTPRVCDVRQRKRALFTNF
jgi:hypothetical protein